MQVRNQKFFRTGEGLCGTKGLRKTFCSTKTQEKGAPHGNILEFFLPHILKTTFWKENFLFMILKKVTQSRPFFQKLFTFLDFQKGQGRSPLSPLVEHQWVCLNMHQYLWICLNIFENAWIVCSDYARALNMHDHLTFVQASEDAWSSK